MGGLYPPAANSSSREALTTQTIITLMWQASKAWQAITVVLTLVATSWKKCHKLLNTIKCTLHGDLGITTVQERYEQHLYELPG